MSYKNERMKSVVDRLSEDLVDENCSESEDRKEREARKEREDRKESIDDAGVENEEREEITTTIVRI